MDLQWLNTQFLAFPSKSKNECARDIGVSPAVFQKIMSGSRAIKEREYISLRQFFGLPVDGYKNLPPANVHSYETKHLIGGASDAAINHDEFIPLEKKPSIEAGSYIIFTASKETNATLYLDHRILIDTSDQQIKNPDMFLISDGCTYFLRYCFDIKNNQISVKMHRDATDTNTLDISYIKIIGRAIAMLHPL